MPGSNSIATQLDSKKSKYSVVSCVFPNSRSYRVIREKIETEPKVRK
jgi:hypothetical protein